MESGTHFPTLGDPGPSNRRDGEYTGPLFPQWGDKDGDFSKLVILRMEAEKGELPKDPFLIRKSVESHLGVRIESAYPEARGVSYVLKMRNKKHVDKLIKMNQLTNGFAIKISEHPVLNFSKCVINCAESTHYTDEDIKENLKEQGVTSIRRITKRSGLGDARINTPTIILTLEGTVVPQHIDFGWIRCKTRSFYPSPMLCYACFEFGHTRLRCQQRSTTCGNCSGQHEISKDDPCTLQAFCKRCSSNNHQLSSRKCPIYVKEEEIQHIRVDMGISYPAAKRAYEQQHNVKSMAAVVTAGNDQRFAEITAKLDQVLAEMEKKDRKIDTLVTKIQEQDAEIAKKNDRISKLEAILKINPQERLSIAKQHGTVQDLVVKVKLLEAEVASKNREIASILATYPTNETISSKTTLSSTKNKAVKCTQPQQLKSRNHLASNTSDTEQQQSEAQPSAKKKIRKQNSVEKDSKRLKNDSPLMYISDTEMENSPSAKETDPNTSFSSGDEGATRGRRRRMR